MVSRFSDLFDKQFDAFVGLHDEANNIIDRRSLPQDLQENLNTIAGVVGVVKTGTSPLDTVGNAARSALKGFKIGLNISQSLQVANGMKDLLGIDAERFAGFSEKVRAAIHANVDFRVEASRTLSAAIDTGEISAKELGTIANDLVHELELTESHLSSLTRAGLPPEVEAEYRASLESYKSELEATKGTLASAGHLNSIGSNKGMSGTSANLGNSHYSDTRDDPAGEFSLDASPAGPKGTYHKASIFGPANRIGTFTKTAQLASVSLVGGQSSFGFGAFGTSPDLSSVSIDGVSLTGVRELDDLARAMVGALPKDIYNAELKLKKALQTGAQVQKSYDHDVSSRGANEGHHSNDAGKGGVHGRDDKSGHTPIVLDLAGTGINIAELNSSNTFFDVENDGYKYRTAWAGIGNGVLAIDADGDGEVDQQKEIIFTEWDPSAKDDMAALKSVFDTNDNGKLDAGDAQFAKFRVVVTNADGTTTLKTLGQLGITEIDLTPDATYLELQDGSAIQGQTKFTMNGVEHVAAAVSFATEGQGFAIQNTDVTNPDGSKTITNRALNADGSLASVTVTTTSASGNNRTITFDRDGDGVIDDVHMIAITSVLISGVTYRQERLEVRNNGGVLLSSTQTQTSLDGSQIIIERDTRGGGYMTESEIRQRAGNGDLTVTLSTFNPDGSLVDKIVKSTSNGGLTRVEAYDLDGNNTTDLTVSDVTVVNAGGSRTETITETNGNGSLRRRTITNIDVTGQISTVTDDLNGDGVVDVTTSSTVGLQPNGTTSQTATTVHNGTTLTSSTLTTISGDGLTATQVSDLDGDGDTDTSDTDTTVLNVNGDRQQTVEMRNGDGSLRSKSVIMKKADGRGRDIQVDSDGDSHNDRTETVTIDGGGISTDTVREWTANGTKIRETVTTSNASGLNSVTQIDADANGSYETVSNSITVINGDGSSTVTDSVVNGDSTLRTKTITTVSANGLTRLVESDLDGDGNVDAATSDVTTVGGDDSHVRTVTQKSGNGAVLARQVTTTDATRDNVSIVSDTDGDGVTDRTETILRESDGDIVDTVNTFNDNGGLIGRNVTTTSSNGLSTVTQVDQNGDGSVDQLASTVTTLNANGSRTTVTDAKAGNGTLLNRTTTIVSDDGYATTTDTDLDGDGTIDASSSDVTALNTNGSRSRVITDIKSGKSVTTTVSANGLSTTTSSDEDGDGDVDAVTTDATVLNGNGSSTRTVTRARNGIQIDQSTTTTSSDGRTVTATTTANNVPNARQSYTRVVEADGDIVETAANAAENNALLNKSVTTTSANGLSVTNTTDTNGDGIVDLTMQSTTALNIDGSKTTSVTRTNGDGSLLDRTETTVSDNGMETLVRVDRDGASGYELATLTSTNINADGSKSVTATSSFANGAVASKTVTYTSAVGHSVSITADIDGDGVTDRTETILQVSNGDTVDTVTTLAANAAVIKKSITTTSANGLLKTKQIDINGDGVFDSVVTDSIVLNANGGRAETITTKSGNGTRITESVKTTSGDGLSITTTSDLNGDGTTDLTITDVTTLGVAGSRTRTLSELNANGSLRDRTVTTIASNGLSTTTTSDINGDGAVDLTSTDVTVLETDGRTKRTVSSANSHGLRDQSITTTSTDGRTVTQDSIGHGSVNTKQHSTRFIEVDGDVVETTDNLNAATDALLNRVTETTSANGLAVRTETDQNGDGTVDYWDEALTTLNLDGSRITTTTSRNAAGINTRSVKTVSASGLSAVEQVDDNGDGTFDLTRTSLTVLGNDGSTTETVTETNANGSSRLQTIKVTSGDKKTVTTTTSRGGVTVSNETRILQSNGDLVETASRFNATGVALTTLVTTSSANGLTKVSQLKDANGTVIETKTSQKVINVDGSTTETSTQSGVVGDSVVTTTSADGLLISSQATMTGHKSATQNTTDVTVLNVDGSRTQTVAVAEAGSSRKDKATIVTSADGLSRVEQVDVNGDSVIDNTISSITAADGSKTDSMITRNSATGALIWKDVRTVSVDGRTTTLERDSDGNGSADQFETVVSNADGSVTTTRTGTGVAGAPSYSEIKKQEITLDGGTRETAQHFSALGALLDSSITVASANGLVKESRYDTNGDGTDDQFARDIIQLNADGSQSRIEEFKYTAEIVKSRTVTTTSADGTTATVALDNDGNNIVERSFSLTKQADGSQVTTVTDFDNKTGAQTKQVVYTTRADEMGATVPGDLTWNVSTVVSSIIYVNGGKEDHHSPLEVQTVQTTTSTVSFLDTKREFKEAHGSYQWVRTNASQVAGSTMHLIDANGIDTWSWNIDSTTLWNQTTTNTIVAASGTIQIDLDTKQKYLDIASKLYGTLLDREMTGDESEFLAQYIQNGAFNKTLLASNIIASSEFVAKYGALTNAAFIDVFFQNTLGDWRPAAQGDYLAKLTAGTLTLGGAALAISENAGDLAVIRSLYRDGIGTSTASYANATAAVTANLAAPATNTGEAAGDYYAVISNLIGSNFNDTLTGNVSNNILSGGAGADRMYGGAGDDTYIVDDTGDMVYEDASAGNDTINSYIDLDISAFANVENVTLFGKAQKATGNAGSNILIGNGVGNTLKSDDSPVGNDTLIGGAGADVLIGGQGNDIYVFNRGDGQDSVLDRYEGYVDAITSTGPTHTLSSSFSYTTWYSTTTGGKNGTTTWNSKVVTTPVAATAPDVDVVTTQQAFHLNAGSDVLQFGAGIVQSDLVFELRGTDLFVGLKDPLAPSTKASALSDSIRLSNWVDVLDRVETIKFADGSTVTIASLVGAISTPSYNAVAGTAGNDTLTGSVTTDRITGGSGNDILDGKAGDDRLEGGAGNDVYSFGRGGGWDIVLDENRWQETTVQQVANAPTYGPVSYTYSYVEAIYHPKVGKDNPAYYTYENRTGTAYVTFTDSGTHSVTSTVWREDDGGVDKMSFGAGVTVEDIAANLQGDDLLIALRNRDGAIPSKIVDTDNFFALDDQIRIVNWSNGKSRLETFSFADGTEINVANLLSAVTGGAGNDVINGGVADDWLAGSAGDDVLAGNAGQDILIGGSGNDILAGGAGADRLYGGDGMDTADYSASSSAVTIDLSNNANNTGGDAAGDLLFGIEAVTGSAGNDVLKGDSGSNRLLGGAGNDILEGGAGNDVLIGGQGVDEFKFGRSDGADIVDAYDTDGGADKLSIGTGVSKDQLWFTRAGDDLIMSIIGSQDQVTVQGWYADSNRKLDRISLSDGKYATAGDIEQLRSAMASFSPPPLGQMNLDPTIAQSLAPTLAANWH